MTLKSRLAAGIVTLAAAAAAPCYAQSSAPHTGWMGGRMDTDLYIGGECGPDTVQIDLRRRAGAV